MPVDRADLARQRQLMRVKQTTPSKSKLKSNKTKKESISVPKSASPSVDLPTKTTVTKPVKRASTASVSAKSTHGTTTASTSMTLIVRQILQRMHYGDAAEYLATTKKEELFRLLGQIAQHAYELREQFQLEVAAMKEEAQQSDERRHQMAEKLLELEAQLAAGENDRQAAQERETLTKAEYTAVVDDLRKYEREWEEAQTTITQQQQLLQEMSRSLHERTSQVDSLTNELELTRSKLEELRELASSERNQVQVLELESARMQQHLVEERRENKALAWELQTKTRDCDDLTNQLEDAKDRIVTLEGQIEMELIGRKALVQERDNVVLLHRRERDAWKAAQDARSESELRKAQEYRSMDLEIRQLKQLVSRMRTDLESERIQREKAESAALKATDMADELKTAGKTVQADVQRLAAELREERSVREAKESALAVAYRDMQSLHKRVREEESARADAQSEVEALSHRMTLIRRDHLAMLHRVETPPQAAHRWRESADGA